MLGCPRPFLDAIIPAATQGILTIQGQYLYREEKSVSSYNDSLKLKEIPQNYKDIRLDFMYKVLQ